MPWYDTNMDLIRLQWVTPKQYRSRCGAKCRDGSQCAALPVWDKVEDHPVNGRCRMHGGLSTGPKTLEGRRRIGESARLRGKRNASEDV